MRSRHLGPVVRVLGSGIRVEMLEGEWAETKTTPGSVGVP